ncbi:streptophobe family protein [Streptomyces sp. NPDC051907]|uniref:streptophobe family protein n=1 Tax=Streptomyces sp. NPDC051907 TaxID=3155284 RepID=UPI00343BE094
MRWGDVLLTSVAAVSWALVGMAGAAALGLHLLGADSAGALGPMTAAVTVLAVNGSVTPTGDVSVFGLEGAEARTAVDITPLGVSLVGALFLAYFFLRSLRGAGPCIPGSELAARAAGVTTLFVAMVGGLAWAGHDVITIDGAELGLDLDRLPGGGGDGGIEVPGLGEIGDIGDIGDIGGLLPDRLGDLVEAEAAVGFSVDTADSLAGALFWVLGVLIVSVLASRRTPLPPGAAWDAVRRSVRPAASALVTVLLVAVLAGYAAAAYAASGDENPRRIAGAALLGAPNGVWLGVPLGLFVPWDAKATGPLASVLPDPMDELLRLSADEPVTVGRLAGLDQRVWLLAVAAGVMMLCAGVLAAARTPRGGLGPAGFAGRCALRLGLVTALTLPLLVWLTEVSADASLSVLGVNAVGGGVELHGHLGLAPALGAAWGTAAGGLGALVAYAAGAGDGSSGDPARTADPGASGAYDASASGPYEPGSGTAWPYDPGAGTAWPYEPGASNPGAYGAPPASGPYRPAPPYRPANPDTNPYLRPPPGIHGAPTVAGRPMAPPPKQRRPQPFDDESGPPPPGPPPPGAPGRRDETGR